MSDVPDTSDKPALTLGDPPGRLAKRGTAQRTWMMWVVLALQLILLILLLANPRSELNVRLDTMQAELAATKLQATAIALESRSLSSQAADAWREYLRLDPSAENRAEILYRIGRLLMDADECGDAAAALVQADELTDDEELKAKIGSKLIECLRRLGKYGEVGRELSRQVEVRANDVDRGDVLATFAGESFTEADLDRMIEGTIDRGLAMQPDGAYAVTREQLLQHYSSGEARQKMLQEILQRELFSRRARELELDRQDEFIHSREFLESELLANRFLADQLEQIQPTDVDIESYYAAQQADYRRPESANVVALPVEQDQLEDVLEKIASADDFRRLAEEAVGPNQSTPLQIARGQRHPLLGETAALFELEQGQWTKTPVQGPGASFLVLVDSKSPATTPSLEEVRFRVEADYRARKRQELTQGIFEDLTARYDVKILAKPPSNVDDPLPGESSSTPDDVEAEVDP